MVIVRKLGMLGMAALLGGATLANAKEYVVKLKTSDSTQLAKMTEISGYRILDMHAIGDLVKIDIPDQDKTTLAAAINSVMADPMVQYVVPNIKMHAFGKPDDPKYSQQWALEKVKAPNAWAINSGSRDVVVAVIDTGVDWQHEDLKENIYNNDKEIAGNGIDDDNNGLVDDIRGWDFRYNDNDPMDETSSKNPGHGTHCAGIIGAVFNNGVGIAGMAPGISILPVRFLGSDGSGDLMTGAKAIDYAVTMNADVISASWGAAVSKSQIMPILEAIERANAKGIAFVVAAANDGKNNDTTDIYPANSESLNVIAVAASGSADTKPSWSNYGRGKVHVASPGENIYSTLPGGKYGNLSGTSMATPLVAGLVGLLKSQALEQGNDISPLAMRSILQSTGASVAIETACDCRVDAEAALSHLKNDNLTVVPAALTLDPGSSFEFSAIGGNAPYSFVSSDENIASIDGNGSLSAKAEGEVKVTVKDAKGMAVTSKSIFVKTSSGGGGGGGGECPLGDPSLCEILCQIDPTLPWCG